MDSISLTSFVLVVLIYFPGFLFKRFYFSGSFTRQLNFGDILERIFTSLFWGFWIQLIALLITKSYYSIEYQSVWDLLYKLSDSFNQSNVESSVVSIMTLENIASYVSLSCILGVIVGYTSHHLIRKTRLDVMIKALRFSNRWHYYFRGEIRSDLSNYKRKGKVISTEADVLVDLGDGNNKLYSGFLSEYMISSVNGELETITLTSPRRFSFSKNEFIDIPGDCFIIPYGNIRNINLRYQTKLRTIEDLENTVVTALSVILICSYLTIPIVLAANYYTKVNILSLITSCIFFLIAWTFVIVFFRHLLDEEEKKSNEVKKSVAIIGSLLLIVIFSFAGILLIK